MGPRLFLGSPNLLQVRGSATSIPWFGKSPPRYKRALSSCPPSPATVHYNEPVPPHCPGDDSHEALGPGSRPAGGNRSRSAQPNQRSRAMGGGRKPYWPTDPRIRRGG